MPLTVLSETEYPGVRFNPGYFSAEDLFSILNPADEPAEDDGPELPDALAQLLETGGSREDATKAVKEAFDAGCFDHDDPVSDRDAFFDQLKTEVDAHPDHTTFDPALAAANLEALHLFNVVQDGDSFTIEADGEEILHLTLGRGKDSAKDFAKLVLFVQTILDVIALGLAFLKVQVERGKDWAKTVSNKLGKAKKWFEAAKSAFGKFNKFYKTYLDLTKNEGKLTKLQIFEKLGGAFGKAFLGFMGAVLKQSLKIVKELLKVIFGTIGDVLRFLIRLGVAIAEWLGYSLGQLAVVIVNAVYAATYVLDDLLAWKAL